MFILLCIAIVFTGIKVAGIVNPMINKFVSYYIVKKANRNCMNMNTRRYKRCLNK
jgi:hypothetical protein